MKQRRKARSHTPRGRVSQPHPGDEQSAPTKRDEKLHWWSLMIHTDIQSLKNRDGRVAHRIFVELAMSCHPFLGQGED